MLFRWIGARRRKPAAPTNRRRLMLDEMEERSVPSATDLGVADNYNAFVFNNYTGTNSDVEGALAVGNNASLTNFGVGGSLPNSHGTVNDLVVGNNLTYHNGEVFNGNVVFGHSASLTSVGVPNGTVSPGNPISFSSAESDLETKSTIWAGYGTTGTIVNNWGSLVLTGSSPTLEYLQSDCEPGFTTSRASPSTPPPGPRCLSNVSGTSVTMQEPFGMNVIPHGLQPCPVQFEPGHRASRCAGSVSGNILAPKRQRGLQQRQRHGGHLGGQKLYGDWPARLETGEHLHPAEPPGHH